MLEVQHLTRYYGALAAVIDVSFTVGPGEVLGYLGPNGSGKSTTVRMLAGLMPPSRGRILWNGRDIEDDLNAYKALVGFVPEEAEVYKYLTAVEYLADASIEMVRTCAYSAMKNIENFIDEYSV